ncbi:MAG: winged helix-turn-helix domain-containing protein [Pseudomonadota bacterium]
MPKNISHKAKEILVQDDKALNIENKTLDFTAKEIELDFLNSIKNPGMKKNTDILTNIFVYSDDSSFSNKLSKCISKPDCSIHVYTFKDCDEFVTLAKKHTCHLCYLDVNKNNGAEIVKFVQAINANTTIIGMLVSLDVDSFDTEEDVQRMEVQCLNSGAEAVMRKPFTASAFIAYMNLALKRKRQYSDRKYKVGVLTFVLDKCIVYYYNTEVKLTKTQFLIVYTLFLNAGKIVTKEELVDKVQALDDTLKFKARSLNHKSLDVAMCKIREAFRDARTIAMQSPVLRGRNMRFPVIDENMTTIWARGYYAVRQSHYKAGAKVDESFDLADDESYANEIDKLKSRNYSILQLNDGISVKYNESELRATDRMLNPNFMMKGQ